MANTNLNEKTPTGTASNTMQDATSSVRETARESIRNVRDTADRMKSDLSDRMNRVDASEMMDRASETANQFYGQATDWMRDNSRMLYMVGGFLAVGIVGYIVGRGFVSRSSDIETY